MSALRPIASSMLFLFGALLSVLVLTGTAQAQCQRTVTAEVVALDQPIMLNRMGASQPGGMVFALKRDVVTIDPSKGFTPGNVQLRPDKRPRPIVLRANVGDCLQIVFTNWLDPMRTDPAQPQTRSTSLHVNGLEWAGSSSDDGSNVGKNSSSLVGPGSTTVYTLHAAAEGTYLLYSGSSGVGGASGGQITEGLFGSVNVQPAGAEWYRSQVTQQDLVYAIDTSKGNKGFTADGHPILNYNAIYPPGAPRAGMPVLKMLDSRNQLVYTDLTAIITGPNAGNFDASTGDPLFKPVPASPHRTEPYRELTTIYNEPFDAIQAFPEFYDPVLGSTTFRAGKDLFGINYGTGGIGAEVLANRLGVGPMGGCSDCKFEEFFLASWAVGDPAMLVDKPANAPCTSRQVEQLALNGGPSPCTVQTGSVVNGVVNPVRKATRAFYPDDPSNVYHSYLNDHVKFRVLHGGTGVTHVHHQHAHQWLHTPNSADSTYLDSQMISPGTAYTLEMTYGGSGNRNKTPGDSIFHCHFYPHFAAGMWGLWRVHDVFEAGTELKDGIPVAGARALPDGEIAAGTPIPALVPIPSLPMAPIPGKIQIVPVNSPAAPGGLVGYRADVLEPDKNPGFPFFVPGIAGIRAPHPPLDFAKEGTTVLDGGLPRHLVLAGTMINEKHNRLDFSKDLGTITAVQLPEDGTPVEKVAMAFHGTCFHPTFRPDGSAGQFRTNGLPPVAGAPFADPALDPDHDESCDSAPTVNVRRYKAAVIQTDVVFNKQGWHYPQQRFLTLWGDVQPSLEGRRAPEPFFFRANSGEAVEFWHTNLVPDYYELDDFQVRTPTDIIGQHIHLVKFDVLASDGATNGFNYEDGTLSPDDVRGRINAINATGGLSSVSGGAKTMLTAKTHPVLGAGPHGEWVGAQTTIQRWFMDPLLGSSGTDRTVPTVFTHDHFGPSTHQQVGLYAGLIVEEKDSRWFANESNEELGTRDDGGPTSWQARILTADPSKSHREFVLEFQDFQLAYLPTSITDASRSSGWSDPANAIGAPGCPSGLMKPCPTLISAGPETPVRSVNYRSEPLPFRVTPPGTPAIVLPDATDLSHVFRSIPRYQNNVNRQPSGPIEPGSPFRFPGGFTGAQGTDPYTPLMRAYEKDNVEIEVLVGAHQISHSFSIHGLKWLFEPFDSNSGYRNVQAMGISEHFEFKFRLPETDPRRPHDFADYPYIPSLADTDKGLWGLLRAYNRQQPDLVPINGNLGKAAIPAVSFPCPADAFQNHFRSFAVTAITANQALGGPLVYNGRLPEQQIKDPYALLYVRDEDLQSGRLRNRGGRFEPLILRANAGDCIELTLTNALDPGDAAFSQGSVEFGIPLLPSTEVGIRPQLLSYDVTQDNGVNAGFNPEQTVKPGERRTYRWYAGNISLDKFGAVEGTPVEFGAINLLPSDPLEHTPKGMVGAMVIEPPGAVWRPDPNSSASANVYKADGRTLLFREFVNVTQDDVTLYMDTVGGKNQPLGVSHSINNGTEPLFYRYPNQTGLNPGFNFNEIDMSQALSNARVGGDPVTPVFTAQRGAPVRFRMLHPGGNGTMQLFLLHGHTWQEEPYTANSTQIGNNPLSQPTGTRDQYGPNDHFEIVLPSAGGAFQVAGDYLFRTFPASQFSPGLWGIFRVTPSGQDSVMSISARLIDDQLGIEGLNTVNPVSGKFAEQVSLSGITTIDGESRTIPLGTAPVDPQTGRWSFSPDRALGTQFSAIKVTSSFGAIADATVSTGPAVRETYPLSIPTPSSDESLQYLRQPRQRP